MTREQKQKKLAKRTAAILNEMFKLAQSNIGIRQGYRHERFVAGLSTVCNPFNENSFGIEGIIIDDFPDESCMWIMPYITADDRKLYIVRVWKTRTRRKDCGKPYKTYRCTNVEQLVKAVADEMMKAIANDISCPLAISEYVYNVDHNKLYAEKEDVLEDVHEAMRELQKALVAIDDY